MDGTFSDPARDDLRARKLVALGRWYSPWAHLLVPTGVGLVVVASALVGLDHVQGLEWGVPVVTWVLANATEFAGFYPYLLVYMIM